MFTLNWAAHVIPKVVLGGLRVELRFVLTALEAWLALLEIAYSFAGDIGLRGVISASLEAS